MNKIVENVLKKDTTSTILTCYTVSKQGISTIEFYLDSLLAFKNILDCYFDKILKNENLDEIRECVMRLQDIRYNCNVALEKVKLHADVLAEFQDQKIAPTALLEKEHLRLIKILNTLKEDFNHTKKEIFSITECTIEISKEEIFAIELEKIKVARSS